MKPKKLAIYYGWPSTVNATYSVNGAADVFKDYDVIVFGAGLQNSSHGDHLNTKKIINHNDMVNTQVYGYITMTDSEQNIKNKIDNWHAMGVVGIFCDEFGYDYGITRTKQNTIIDYIHNKTTPTLKAFVNAWHPDDVYSNDVDVLYNPLGLSHHLNTDDLYLLESFAIKDNDYDNLDTNADGILDWEDKINNIIDNYHGQSLVASVATTGSSTASFVQNKADYSYYLSCLYGLYAWGWGEINYSSAGGANSLPFRTRKDLPGGTKLHGDIHINGNVIERNTNAGFHIDKSTHAVSDLLD